MLSVRYYFCFSLIILCVAFAQVDTAWVRRYTGPGNQDDIPKDIIVDDSGYVYITGESYGAYGYKDVLTLKYSPSGDTIWERRYDGGLQDAVVGMVLDKDNNVCIAGNTESGGGIQTLKYQQDGTFLWARQHPGSARGITCDTAGYIYVTGGGSDIVTIKYTPGGDTLWTRYYNGVYEGIDNPNDITCDIAGNVYVVGYSQMSAWADEYVTIKYNTDGANLWTTTYTSGNGDNTARAVCVDDSGYVYVTGYSESAEDNRDYYTIKYDADGNVEWQHRYDDGNDWADGMTMDSDGFITITGTVTDTILDSDILTVKYNKNGDVLWARRYDGPDSVDDGPHDIEADTSGNIYITGYSASDCITLKYTPAGDHLWTTMYDGAGMGNNGLCIDVDDSLHVYVGAKSVGVGTNQDYATIKYRQTIIEIKEVEGFSTEYSVFGPTIFSGPLLLPEGKKCIIFDVTGRRVTYDKIQPGIYFVEVDGVFSRKVVKVR